TGIHVALGLLAEIGLLGHVGAQHVAGRDERQLEVGLQALGLRSLAGPGGPEQNEIELRRHGVHHCIGRAARASGRLRPGSTPTDQVSEASSSAAAQSAKRPLVASASSSYNV